MFNLCYRKRAKSSPDVSKLLFDQNISYRIVKKLKDDFPECKHISDVELKDEEDPEIWNYAKKYHFTIVTFDSDFYETGLIQGYPPKIIDFKLLILVAVLSVS